MDQIEFAEREAIRMMSIVNLLVKKRIFTMKEFREQFDFEYKTYLDAKNQTTSDIRGSLQ